ncbi:hypothetical protein HSBAA_49450 [Vreelandella sulfidaeris]|uniref:Uncharacterized protein n=1 Tax=Vreelandella sulfidaeris TaxID=115553 RepID=A0A455UHF0_9GAMM|nr:hypothetical protein HSBAA_49450 [Halomonas sulfidaeris]
MSDLAIEVNVVPSYRADESSDVESRYVFSYTITVHNQSPIAFNSWHATGKSPRAAANAKKCVAKALSASSP